MVITTNPEKLFERVWNSFLMEMPHGGCLAKQLTLQLRHLHPASSTWIINFLAIVDPGKHC